MSYSNALVPNDDIHFPAPPTWLVWISDEAYYQSEYAKARDPEKAAKHKGKGKVRHVESLSKAKGKVSRLSIQKQYLDSWNRFSTAQDGRQTRIPSPSGKDWMADEWFESWAIYEWTGEKYELRYSAERGEFKTDHPLFAKPMKKDTGKRVRTVAESELEAAMASILRAS